MADAREQAAFFDNGGGQSVPGVVERQQLQRDLAIEPRVPGPIDVAEGAAPDRSSTRMCPQIAARPHRTRGRIGQGTDGCEHTESSSGPVGGVRGTPARPIHGAAVENRPRHV